VGGGGAVHTISAQYVRFGSRRLNRTGFECRSKTLTWQAPGEETFRPQQQTGRALVGVERPAATLTVDAGGGYESRIFFES
jgi:hypothetical protein